MGFLTDYPTEKIIFDRRMYKINPAFNTILDIQKLYREDLPDILKLGKALEILITNKRAIKALNIEQQADLLTCIYEKCVNMPKGPQIQHREQVIDFEYDGEYIYASFMLDYNIDLIDMQDKLPWKKFIALFQGLSDDTKIRKVMQIRQMDIPEYNGRNQKEIQEIQELKAYYALPVRGGGGQKGLDLLFGTLERMAVKR